MANYKLVIFDWDGTVMDSTARIVSSMQKSAQQCGLPIPDADAVRHIIGLSLPLAMQQLFGQLTQSNEDQLRKSYKRFYISEDDTPTPLFSSALPLLNSLHGKTHLAVATGKGREGLERVWNESNTKHYFSFSRCADEARSKPDPDMLEQILGLAQVDVADAVMIGDTSFDMQMAEAIGMDRIGVSFGAHNEEKLRAHKPMAIVHDLAEIINLV